MFESRPVIVPNGNFILDVFFSFFSDVDFSSVRTCKSANTFGI